MNNAPLLATSPTTLTARLGTVTVSLNGDVSE
jgi:hypothetical protein